MKFVNVTLRSIVVSVIKGTSKGDAVIVDGGAVRCHGEISTDPTNGKRHESKPFDRADGEPLDVTEGDGERENLSVLDVQINIHHVGGGKLTGGS
jgi:hypothetical protein